MNVMMASTIAPITTPKTTPSFWSLRSGLGLALLGEPVCSARADVVVGASVAAGWTLYVEEPTTTAVGQVSVLIAVSDVDG